MTVYIERRVPIWRFDDTPMSSLPRLLSPFEYGSLDESDVIEAIHSYLIDLGADRHSHRFQLCSVGVALGFCGKPRPEWCDQWTMRQMAAGFEAGADARILHEAMRGEQ